MAEQAEKTGEWIVAVWETEKYLLAVHGPYASAGEARTAAEKANHVVRPSEGGHADALPLWHPEHVGLL